MKRFNSRHRHAEPQSGTVAVWSDFCAVAPSPELKVKLKEELSRLRDDPNAGVARSFALARAPRRLGFDDGVIVPPEHYPLGTSAAAISRAAAERAPLRGEVRVVVVLVDFSDKSMTQPNAHFEELFFSSGVLPNGSVKEYYHEVTNGAVDITGEVVGPFRLPQTLAWYANNNFGIGRPSGEPRANILAQDAAVAADPSVNFAPYDNDGNGFVDAFIVVHAGPGGEQTGNPGDIWSHKWTLPGAYDTDGKQIYAYLTIPEDSRIGVCAHELGHLLFGFPDLYDTDNTSEGIGNWCLMAGGSWNGHGDVPAHPSAWCKVQQGWVSVNNITASATLSIPDVKTSHNVHRLWKDGSSGSEYFLIENRQRTGYDAQLPGDGLLIWHIDENQSGNTDENHYKVGLVQADNARDLELDHNRGDGTDPYPGSAGNTSFTASTTPSSKSYTGQDTCVSIRSISASGPTMTASVAVTCGKSIVKDTKDRNDKHSSKDLKETRKELLKERKDIKDQREAKDPRKDLKDMREGRKPAKESAERPHSRGAAEDPVASAVSDLLARVAALEAAVGTAEHAEAFIDSSLRPDLIGAPAYDAQEDELQERMASGDHRAKIAFDTMPPR